MLLIECKNDNGAFFVNPVSIQVRDGAVFVLDLKGEEHAATRSWLELCQSVETLGWTVVAAQHLHTGSGY